MTLAIKDPDARVDYMMDWSADCPDGQTVTASSWSAAPAEPQGLTIHGQSHDLLRTAVTISGGRAGQLYQLSNRVTLSDGQIDEQTIAIRVETR